MHTISSLQFSENKLQLSHTNSDWSVQHGLPPGPLCPIQSPPPSNSPPTSPTRSPFASRGYPTLAFCAPIRTADYGRSTEPCSPPWLTILALSLTPTEPLDSLGSYRLHRVLCVRNDNQLALVWMARHNHGYWAIGNTALECDGIVTEQLETRDTSS